MSELEEGLRSKRVVIKKHDLIDLLIKSYVCVDYLWLNELH